MGEFLAKALDQLREATPEPGVEYELALRHMRWEPMDGGWAGRWCDGCDECLNGVTTMRITRVEYDNKPIKLWKKPVPTPEK